MERMKVRHHRLCRDDGAAMPYVETSNMGGRLRPAFVVIHYTAGPSLESAIGTLTTQRARGNVSAHLVIGPEGEVVQLAPFDRVTWHAGRSRWEHGGVAYEGLNEHAVGIELVNAGPLTPLPDGRFRSWWGRRYDADVAVAARHKHGGPHRFWHRFPEAQVAAATEAARVVAAAYDALDVLGHDDIAPGRKTDPGPAFPMARVRAAALAPPAPDPGQVPSPRIDDPHDEVPQPRSGGAFSCPDPETEGASE